MTADKYSKCIKTGELKREIPYYFGKKYWRMTESWMWTVPLVTIYIYNTKPIAFGDKHAHEFAEMLCFNSADSQDISELGAEIEFTIGGETHSITADAVISFPLNVKHCPIVTKNVKRPIVFIEISLMRIWKPGRRPGKKAELPGESK